MPEQEIRTEIREDSESLKIKWNTEGRLTKGKVVIVDKVPFRLDHYDEQGKAVVVSSIKEVGKVVMTVEKSQLLSWNNPVKTAREWFNLYLAITDSALVRNPGLINDRLMTIAEFQEQVKGIAGVDKQKLSLWEDVAYCLRDNLDQLVVSDEVWTRRRIKEKIEYLQAKPVTQHEVPSSGLSTRGRRSIVSGSDESGGFFLWQGRTYAPSEEGLGELGEVWRAYLQVEVADIPRVVEILDKMGERMANEGRTLDLKFLIAKTAKITEQLFDIGEYRGLTDTDPRVVVYFADKNERETFIRSLVNDYHQEMIEMANRRDGKARRPGTSVVYDGQNGRELRHVNVLDQVGFSENVAADPYWRFKVRGEPTRYL